MKEDLNSESKELKVDIQNQLDDVDNKNSYFMTNHLNEPNKKLKKSKSKIYKF